jgi:putative transposase
MSSKTILRPVEFKLYPTVEQARTLSQWLNKCCWLYNQALEQRIKSYRRRKQAVSYNVQCAWLTGLRERIDPIRLLPLRFARSALRRVDRGMQAFFRRVKAGERRVGFPRFRSSRRYNSIEYLASGHYIDHRSIRIPKLGTVRARGQFDEVGAQGLLRVIRRASGWYAQVILEQECETLPPTQAEVGIDLGLESFLVTDTGERIGNPRHLRRAAKKLRRAQQRLSRRQRGSNRRKAAVKHLARLHEQVARKRRGFCHRVSREMVNRFDRIAVEKLNVKGLAASRLAKHVLDACWGTFLFYLRYKAEDAGRVLVEVDPSGTSQECPACGRVARKELSEREHNCPCGLRCHRDRASAQVIRQRAFRPARGELVRPGLTQARLVKREWSTCC